MVSHVVKWFVYNSDIRNEKNQFFLKNPIILISHPFLAFAHKYPVNPSYRRSQDAQSISLKSNEGGIGRYLFLEGKPNYVHSVLWDTQIFDGDFAQLR
jgi:hypothetical protein